MERVGNPAILRIIFLSWMTPEREKKLQEVIKKRQFDITVVLENVWDPHNISAVLRSCDAVGVQDVYILSPTGKKESKLGKKSSASASKWLTIHHFTNAEDCFSELRKHYRHIFSSRIAEDAKPLYEMDFCSSLALVFGNEKDGVSEKVLSLSDGSFVIPQVGMIQSLNISVACAVTLYECYRQRTICGSYNGLMADGPRSNLLEKWRSAR
jgi:tRNA (guanosine-2'-O-)-methyltransferase